MNPDRKEKNVAIFVLSKVGRATAFLWIVREGTRPPRAPAPGRSFENLGLCLNSQSKGDHNTPRVWPGTS